MSGASSGTRTSGGHWAAARQTQHLESYGRAREGTGAFGDPPHQLTAVEGAVNVEMKQFFDFVAAVVCGSASTPEEIVPW